MVEERTAELRAHDCDDFRLWDGVPMSIWPDTALRSFCVGHPVLESAIDLSAPTAVEILRVAREHYQKEAVQ